LTEIEKLLIATKEACPNTPIFAAADFWSFKVPDVPGRKKKKKKNCQFPESKRVQKEETESLHENFE
jgi:hypothetical protein